MNTCYNTGETTGLFSVSKIYFTLLLKIRFLKSTSDFKKATHGDMRYFRQSICEDSPRRACPDDDEVVAVEELSWQLRLDAVVSVFDVWSAEEHQHSEEEDEGITGAIRKGDPGRRKLLERPASHLRQCLVSAQLLYNHRSR